MRVITTLLIALVALTGWGCAKKVPNDPYKQEMAKVLMNKGCLVQDLARPENVHLRPHRKMHRRNRTAYS